MDIQTESTEPSHPPSPRLRFSTRLRRWLKRSFAFLFTLVILYGALILIGLIPVNRNFAPSEDGIEVSVFSGPFHSELILPITSELKDWRTQFDSRQFQADTTWATHIAFGWGDVDFYINTPTWRDMTASSACKALFIPTRTVMHVSHQLHPSRSSDVRSVRISTQQYQKLVEFILDSFEWDEHGQVQPLPDESYGSYDAFFRGTGRYHCFRTCNCWVGDGLKAAEVKTGWFTPLPKTVFLYFPD